MEGGQRLLVDVLGPVRLRTADGRDVTPDGDLQRRLLALLVLRRGEHVSADRAVDALWPDRRPRDPLAALQTHVFRLRRALPDGALTSSDHGYWLDPAAVDVDADRVAAAVTDAAGRRAADPDGAAGDLDEAMAAWRGSPYPELVDDDEGRMEADRLDDLRVRVVEERAEALLAVGRADRALRDLTTLVDEHPLRERPHDLLMAALAATGRTVDALRVYDDFRRRLGDDLGIEPSPVLAARHAALLGGSTAPGPGLRHRLPVPITSLIGRDRLLLDAVAMTEAHRLITMLGPGGVGKTRLLVEVGNRLRTQRPDRPVVLAELATASPSTAVDDVASTLGVERRDGTATEDRLATIVGTSEVVVLLDNCEHVLEPIAELVEQLLARCPGLVVVATTRERLRVAGEQLCPVPPLPILEHGGPADELFVERARAVRTGYAPDAADAARISEIVRRLDGLPLAIELAAARLHTMDVADVAHGLDRRFRLLAAGSRTVARHRSLGAAVEWSYALLSGELQGVFTAASTFVGPFDVVSAAAVAAVDESTAADALDALTERSLVVRAPGGRYALLETLRAFGLERLAAEGRDELVRRRHARYWTAWARSAAAGLVRSGTTGLFEIDANLADLSAAFGWLVEQGDGVAAAELLEGVHDFAYLRLRPDVLAWADRAIAVDEDAPHVTALLSMSSTSRWLQGDVAGMAERLEQALDHHRRRGGELPHVVAQSLGDHALFDGRLDEAQRWYEQARDSAVEDPAASLLAQGTIVLARTYAGDPTAVETAATLLATVADLVTPSAAMSWYCAGEAVLTVDPVVARQRLARAVEIAEATGTPFVAGIAGTSLASLEARRGDPYVAAQHYRRLLDHWRRAGVWSTQWTMLRAVAGLLFRLGRYRDAAVLTAAVTSTTSGHRVFGEDEVALAALAAQLRDVLGDAAYEAAFVDGAALDGDAAVEHARRAL